MKVITKINNPARAVLLPGAPVYLDIPNFCTLEGYIHD